MKINFNTTSFTQNNKKYSMPRKDLTCNFATQLNFNREFNYPNYPQIQNNINFSASVIRPRVSATSLHQLAKKKAGEFVKFFQRLTQDTPFRTKFRIKAPYSIRNRLRKHKPLKDLIGGMVITDGSEQASRLFVSKLLEAIKPTRLKIKIIQNAGTPNTEGYIGSKDINQLRRAIPNAKINTGKSAVRADDGYPTCYIWGVTKGFPFEIQLKGYEIDAITAPAHIIYDLMKGKDLRSQARQNLHLITNLKNALASLTPEQARKYEIYRKKCFETARYMEIRKTRMPYPKLPNGVPKELSYENVMKVYNAIR